ncbi:hypothetical protein BH09ACT1_BH09ACT1_00370 [soil metagenome]
MGRGRQKAKHTKVARELKYFSPDTNYNALERELTHPVTGAPVDARLEEDLEKWPEFNSAPSAYTDDYADDEYEPDQNKTA